MANETLQVGVLLLTAGVVRSATAAMMIKTPPSAEIRVIDVPINNVALIVAARISVIVSKAAVEEGTNRAPQTCR